MNVLNVTPQSNVTRILDLRRKGWSDISIAKHLSLPLGIVRTVLVDNSLVLPKKLRWVEVVG